MSNQLSTMPMKDLVKQKDIQKMLARTLKGKASQFTTSLVNVVNSNQSLANVDQMSVIQSAMVASTLDLPIDQNLGYAYVVPFNVKNKETGRWEKKAQLIIGYKGYIQLAQRSGQYRRLNVAAIPEGAFISWDPLAEELKYDFSQSTSDKAVGYAGYFELLNGFTKTVYWTRDQVESHRVANNKAKDKTALTGVWRDNYDAMATKTVLRSMLGRWGILSIEMQNALSNDENEQEAPADIEATESDTSSETTDTLMNQFNQQQAQKGPKDVTPDDQGHAETPTPGDSDDPFPES